MTDITEVLQRTLLKREAIASVNIDKDNGTQEMDELFRKSPHPNISDRAWDILTRYAKSGKAKCNGCGRLIKEMQDAFEFEGNVYHDYCSKNLEGRYKL